MSLAIHGLGTALPPHASSQAKALLIAKRICSRNAEEAAALSSLYRQSGINERHGIFDERFAHDVLNGTRETGCVFLPSGQAGDRGPTTGQRMERYATEVLPLTLAAAQRALNDSGFATQDITHLITISCTGFGAPGLDIGLMTSLPLSPTVERVHVGFMGCHGAINGLRVAQALADSQAQARVLMCAVELCSIHYHYGWDPKKMVANALFADGAAALVGAGHGTATSDAWRLEATGSCLFPKTEYAMTWNIADHGFEMTLSTRVPALLAANLRPWLVSWLHKQDLEIADVGSWIVHPGGPRVLNSVEESLGLPREALAASREVLAECGNMSSPTILFILDRLRNRRAPRPCVALGFGPGLIAEASVFR
jgi:predicted naringenin-chalcone synthase